MSASAAETVTDASPAGSGGAAPAAPGTTPAASGGAQTSGAAGTPGKTGESAAASGQSILGAPADDKSKPAAAGELDIKLPDGMKVDDAALKGYRAALKEMGVADAALASKLVAADVKRQEQRGKDYEAAVAKQNEKWIEEIKADPKYGGENLPKTERDAKQALRQFGGQALIDIISEFGLGNHPVLIKAFAAIGAASREDSSDTGGTGGQAKTPPSREERLKNYYDKSNAAQA